MGEPYLWRMANMSRRTCVVVKQMQSNPIQFFVVDTKMFRHIQNSDNQKNIQGWHRPTTHLGW